MALTDCRADRSRRYCRTVHLGRALRESYRYRAPLPDDVAITRFDIAQIGLTEGILR